MDAPPPSIRAFLTPRKILHGVLCPRPEMKIPIRVATSASSRFTPMPFVIDTGSDVTLIPISVARDYRIVGYELNSAKASLATSINGVLEGYWGHAEIRLESAVICLTCFFYITSMPGRAISGEIGFRHRPEGQEDKWIDRLCRLLVRFIPGNSRPSSDAPLVLGRAGLFGPRGSTFLIQQDIVVLSAIPLLSLE